jgi:hypothetical protein
MLGAIDQNMWGNRGAVPLAWDGKAGPRQRESCGSFFAIENFNAGVELLSNYVTNFGELDMLKVGNTYITSSWDEVGIRTRRMIDYRTESIVEYRRYLEKVWFGDATPDRDTNNDGRIYNAFTGEKLTDWNQVNPPRLSANYYRSPQTVDEKWTKPGAYKLWVDFHRYYTFEFFRRVNATATKKLGKRVECYPFPQAFIIWPGANAFHGLSVYWNSRLNPIINVEHCWPESPAMALNYALTDHLARRNNNIIMGWSWFYPPHESGDMYKGQGDVERALVRMMGHNIDGIHHWIYTPSYRDTAQKQRLQLAYWHNFLAHHYRTFLSRSRPPVAEVAILLPDYSGYFYRYFLYPKQDYAYTAQALLGAHIPFEIIAEEEIELEPDVLDQFRILYVVGSEWTTPTIRRRIKRFIKQGGHVFANADSLSLDIPTFKRTDFLERTFGVRLRHKYKNPFLPSAQTPEEEAWSAELMKHSSPLKFQSHDVHKDGVYSRLWKDIDGQIVRDEIAWQNLDAMIEKMPRIGRGGITQSPIDMRTLPIIKYAKHIGRIEGLETYGEITTAEVIKGKPVAWYEGEVCGVETEQTVWLGTRPGMSLHAIAPRKSLSRTTGHTNPFLPYVANSYSKGSPYVDLIAYAARRAGAKPLVTLTRDRRVAGNVEVLPRLDNQGNMMVFLINHDGTDAVYKVVINGEYVQEKLPKAAMVWNVLKAKLIEKNTDGVFKIAILPHRVAVFIVGTKAMVKEIQHAQAALDSMDLSVPKYFQERPELNKGQYATPIPTK